MTNKDVERRLEEAFSHLTPDVFSKVLSDCSEEKGQVIIMAEKRKKNSWKRNAAGIAAAVLLMLGVFGAQSYRANHAVASTVSLDVNPSISITVNSKERVLEVVPLNNDAVQVVGDMDFSGSSLDVAFNALIGSMLRNGYLSEMANSILVSIDGKDAAMSAVLQQKLAEEMESIFRADGFAGAVLSQTVERNENLAVLAGQYGVSEGKAQFICRLIEKDGRHTFAELAGLSINELNLLASASTELGSVKSVGNASDRGYIGRDAAKKAALTHANKTDSAISDYRCEFDWEDGVMIYEIEFRADGLEYDYEINAATGAVIRCETERDDHVQTGNVPSGAVSFSSEIGKDAAKDIALRHAGLTSGDIARYECSYERENGTMVYEIEFKSGGYEYSYDIDAATGRIVDSGKEWDD